MKKIIILLLYMISKTFIFIVGTIVGAYISQNYKIPDIKKVFDQIYITAQIIEKNLGKEDDKD